MLGHDVFKAREKDRRDIELATVKTGQHVTRDILGVFIAHALDLAEVHVSHKMFAHLAFQGITTLFAHGDDLDRLASREQLVGVCFGQFGDVAVETAAKAAFRRHHHQQVGLVAACAGQQFRRACAIADAGRQTTHHGVETFRVGA